VGWLLKKKRVLNGDSAFLVGVFATVDIVDCFLLNFGRKMILGFEIGFAEITRTRTSPFIIVNKKTTRNCSPVAAVKVL